MKNIVDRFIAAVNPVAGLRRQQARSFLGSFNTGGADTSYAGASSRRRGVRSWFPGTNRNPDDDISFDRQTLVARSRDAYRNQPIARSAVNTKLTSVIGTGLELHCRIDREFLGFATDEEATIWEGKTERLFRAWANSTDADARRKNTFYRLQYTAYKSAKMSGEIFALLPLIPRKGTLCDLRVQLIEADRVSTPFGKTDGPLTGSDGKAVSGSLFDGVETGSWGEPVAYHIETTVPVPFMEIDRKWKRVLAYGPASGRRQVIHFFEEERPGQRRGLPMLTPIIEMLKQITRYSEAELMAAVISGMFTVFIRQSDLGTDILDGAQVANTPGSGTSTEEEQNLELGSGIIIGLGPGESIETANPGRPNQQFGPFITEVIKQIGMGLDIPYEVLTKEFKSSYSASRAAIMQAWEVFNVERGWFVQEFLQPIYVEWLSQMVVTGRIDAPGFLDDVEIQRAYAKAKWYGPVPLQLDPVKEATSAKLRLENMTSTLAEETERNQGGDWEQNLAQLAREKARIKELDLVVAAPIPNDQIPIFAETP